MEQNRCFKEDVSADFVDSRSKIDYSEFIKYIPEVIGIMILKCKYL